MPRKFLLLLVPLMLAGCAETREALGLNRNMPDEFVVVDRAPLTLPPDFKLRPPEPGAPRPQEHSPSAVAEAVALGAPAAPAITTTAASGVEQQVLASAGAARATPEIRRIVDRESTATVSADRHLVDELLWWRHRGGDQGRVVDAAAESARLRGNLESGKPATEGGTPTIEKRKSGWLF